MDIQSELTRAERLINTGKLDDAKTLLKTVLAEDKRNSQAWYLVSKCISDPIAKAESLRRVLLSDPNHKAAKREFDAMNALDILKPPSTMVPASASTGGSNRPFLLIGAGLLAVVIVIGAVIILGGGNRPPTAQSAALNVALTPGNATIDPLAATATALSNQLTSTAQSVINVTQSQNQAAQLTQTATLQGALGATVAAKQTSVAMMSTLPGHLIFDAGTAGLPVGPKVVAVAHAQSITPDNKHVTFIENNDLYIANLDGSEKHVLLTGNPQGTLTWSPDGQHFAFIDKDSQMLSIGAVSGGDMKAIDLKDATHVQSPAWSPDSKLLAFEAGSPFSWKFAMYTVGADASGEVSTVIPASENGISDLHWLPDNQTILFRDSVPSPSRNSFAEAIQSVKRDGSDVQTIAQLPPEFETSEIYYSSNGKWLFFHVEGSGATYLLSAETGALHKTTISMALRAVQWSPDNSTLAGTVAASAFGAGGTSVFWMDAETGNVSTVQANPGFTYSNVIWSPDNKAFLTCYTEAKVGQVLLFPVTQNSTPITLFDQPICPTNWLP